MLGKGPSIDHRSSFPSLPFFPIQVAVIGGDCSKCSYIMILEAKSH